MKFFNAGQSKYGSILISLNTQQTLGNKQYPKTITDANSILSHHKFNTMTSGNKNPNKYSKEHWK
jgi:hypothetical protein